MSKCHTTFMAIAKLIAKESYCERRQVGAVIIKNNNIVSIGYNGTISKQSNICEDILVLCQHCHAEIDILRNSSGKYETMCHICGKMNTFKQIQDVSFLKTNKYVIHAEVNAISNAAKEGISLQDASIYITLSPCIECAKNIISSGITHVIFNDLYKDDAGVLLLKDVGIKVTHLNKTPKDLYKWNKA